MNDAELNISKIPSEFTEWLLAIGCPPDKIPSFKKLSKVCEGQYDMVWKSFMEHVEPKEIIRFKRLNVFCSDLNRCKKNKIFNKEGTVNIVVPQEITLWQEQVEITNRVAGLKSIIEEKKKELNLALEKISSKMSSREISRQRLQDSQRRAWILHQVCEELQAKKQNLKETKSIADSLCTVDDGLDVESKLDKCLSVMRHLKSHSKASTSMLAAPTPIASSSVVSNNDTSVDSEEVISSLVKCRGDMIWKHVQERRSFLISSLQAAIDKPTAVVAACFDPNRILAHTAALHCSLGLEVIQNREKTFRVQQRLSAAIAERDGFLDGDNQCELLVLRSEQTCAEARVKALQVVHEEMKSQTGVFKVQDEGKTEDKQGTERQILALDKAIYSKKSQIKEILLSLDANEMKMLNTKGCLIAMFNGFHKDVSLNDSNKLRGLQVELPQESIYNIWQFYEDWVEKRKDKVELSLDFDASENSINDPIDTNNPKFVDELRVYLTKFSLEKNRKLVFDSGEQIWIFETLEGSLARIRVALQNADLTCSFLCPSARLTYSLQCLIDSCEAKCSMENLVRILNKLKKVDTVIDPDLKEKSEKEAEVIDKIKKRLNENLLSLEKINNTLDVGNENLQLWSSNKVVNYISSKRTVDGRTYKELEAIFIKR